jgi:ParB family chromosome partitioning protein
MKMNLKSLNKAVKATELKSAVNDSSAPSYELDVGSLLPNPYQPRLNEEVEELKASIKECGLIAPIAVALIEGRYIVVGGHRRLKAFRELGYKTIRCNLLENVSDRSLQTLAIVENLQRQDLHPIELAIAVDNALNSGISRAELMQSLGKNDSFISKCLGILKLSPLILDDMQKNKRKVGLEILVELQGLKDEDVQWELYQKYITGGISKEEIRWRKQKTKNKEIKYISKNNNKISMSFAWSHLEEDDKSKLEEELEQLIMRYKAGFKDE